MAQKVSRILVDAVGAGPFEFLTPVASRQQADSERPGPSGSQHVPDTVTDDETVVDWHVEALSRSDKEVRIRTSLSLRLSASTCQSTTVSSSVTVSGTCWLPDGPGRSESACCREATGVRNSNGPAPTASTRIRLTFCAISMKSACGTPFREAGKVASLNRTLS